MKRNKTKVNSTKKKASYDQVNTQINKDLLNKRTRKREMRRRSNTKNSIGKGRHKVDRKTT